MLGRLIKLRATAFILGSTATDTRENGKLAFEKDTAPISSIIMTSIRDNTLLACHRVTDNMSGTTVTFTAATSIEEGSMVKVNGDKRPRMTMSRTR